MQNDKWLIHFSGDDWWQSNPHSRHHITFQFHKAGYKVLWVNPMGLRFPSMKKSGFAKKVVNKLKSFARTVKQVKPSFYIYTFVFLPVFKRGLIEKINAGFVGLQLRIAMRMLGVKNAVAFVTLPTHAPMVHDLLKRNYFSKVIYYYSDQYDQYREITDRKPILEWDALLQSDADAIYCASEEIKNSVKDEYKNTKIVKVIDHQVDFDHFDYQKVTKKKLDIKGPIIGYFGSLTDSNDWAMIEYAAKAKPEWQFVFIGSLKIPLPGLQSMPNVHFLGFIAYEDLPPVALNFSVGIMFWKMTDWIKACSPLKLKEYLALGLPVVSIPILEVVNKYSDFVELASNGPEFVDAVERALESNNPEERRQYAQQFSWKAVTHEMMRDCGLS